MLRRTPLRLAAGSLTIVVAGFAAAPAFAASAEATGTGTAISGTLGPMNFDPLSYSATNDGSGETHSGMNKPAIPLPGGGVANAGVAYQDATTTAKAGKLSSAACAGIAGQGGTVVAAGDGSCLDGGGQISLDAGKLDLSGATLPTAADIQKMLPALPALPTTTPSLSAAPGASTKAAEGATPAADVLPAVDPTDPLGTLAAQIETALKAGLAGLGNPSLTLNTNAIQSFCTAKIGDANGDSTLSDVSLVASVAGTKTTLLTIPSSGSAPNTNVSSASGFSKVVTDALSASLKTSLGGAADPLKLLTDQIQQQIITAATASFSTQLDSALGMLFSATANQQYRADDNSIEVTALALKLLPGASGAIGFDAADLDLGMSTCSAGTFQTDAPTASPTPTVAPTVAPVVPTSVDSGLSGDQGSSPFLPIVGGLMLLAGAGIGVRRFLSTRG